MEADGDKGFLTVKEKQCRPKPNAEGIQTLLDQTAHGKISRRALLMRLVALGTIGARPAGLVDQVIAAGANQIALRGMLGKPFDYIIVGGGGAGCVVARRLAESGAARVLLIEAGSSEEGVESISRPESWFTNLGGPYDWAMKYAPQAALDNREIRISRGKVLGGCSSINAMLWVRGHKHDYDLWAHDGCPGWDFQSILPAFKAIEDWQGGETNLRGAGGLLRCELPNSVHPIAQAMLDASQALGYRVREDVNGPVFGGASLANLNIKDGARHSTARAFLRPIMHYPNLTVLTEHQVDRLVMKQGKVTGVSCPVNGVYQTLVATKDVILTAGALHTPQLLMRSGIGRADDLKALGISPQINLPGVGQNLQDHPLLMGVNIAYHESSLPLSGNGGGAQLIAASGVADSHSDLMIVPIQVPYANQYVAEAYNVPANAFAITPGLMRVQSRGYLKLRSSDPSIAMEIQPNMLQEYQDMVAMERGVELCLDLGAQTAFKSLGKLISPRQNHTKKELKNFIRKSCDTFFHSVGTCKMGQDTNSVVDPTNLRVHGVEGLRVMDASIIPTIPTCNTHAPVVMIAERGAAMVLNDSKLVSLKG
jgi:choline dehydrogenase